MKVLVLKFDDSVDLSAFMPKTAVDISNPAAISGTVLVNAISSDEPTLSGTYNITPVD